MTTTANSATVRVVRECSLDWIKFDATIARDGDLNPTAKALYAALASFANTTTRETDPDPDGWDVPDRKTLAACVGCNVKTIDRQTAVLEEYVFPDGTPLLTVERRRDPDNPKSNLPNLYVLNEPRHWDARAAKRHADRTHGRTNAAMGSRTDVPTPGDTDVPRVGGGGDTGVPTPRDISVAVPLSFKEDLHTPRARVPEPEVEPEAVGVCVENEDKYLGIDEFSVYDGIESWEYDDAVERARVIFNDCVDRTAAKRLAPKQVDDLQEATARVLLRGHSDATVRDRISGITNETTHSPHGRLKPVLVSMCSEQPREAVSVDSVVPKRRPWCGRCHADMRKIVDEDDRMVDCPTCG